MQKYAGAAEKARDYRWDRKLLQRLMKIGDETVEFDPDARTPHSSCSLCCMDGTTIVLIGIGPANQRRKLCLARGASYLLSPTLMPTFAVLAVTRTVLSNSRRDNRSTVLTTPTLIKEELTEQQLADYNARTKVVQFGSIMTAEQLEEAMKKNYTDDQRWFSIGMSLVIAFLFEAREEPKAPSKSLGKYGCWDNKGMKTEINRYLAGFVKGIYRQIDAREDAVLSV